jgi:hypothetical protein
MAVSATTIAARSSAAASGGPSLGEAPPRPFRRSPYIPPEIEGVPRNIYIVEERFDLLVDARIKAKAVKTIRLADNTKVTYKISRGIRHCASDVLSIICYEMAANPFGAALSYEHMAKKSLVGRYGEKCVTIACKLLQILDLIEEPRRLGGSDRRYTWRPKPRDEVIAALKLVQGGDQGRSRCCPSSSKPSEFPTGGTGLPTPSGTQDCTTCDNVAQVGRLEATNRASATITREAAPEAMQQKNQAASTATPKTDPKAASTAHICGEDNAYMPPPHGIYAACESESSSMIHESERRLDSDSRQAAFSSSSAYSLEDPPTAGVTGAPASLLANTPLLPSSPPVVSEAWTATPASVAALIVEICPHPDLTEGEKQRILAQASLILDYLEGLPEELSEADAQRRISAALLYMRDGQPFWKGHPNLIPFCVGKHFGAMEQEMIKKGYVSPQEQARKEAQNAAHWASIAARSQMLRWASRHGIEIPDMDEAAMDALASSWQQLHYAELERWQQDERYEASDAPYLRLFAEFGCHLAPIPPTKAAAAEEQPRSVLETLCVANPPSQRGCAAGEGEEPTTGGMSLEELEEAEQLVRRIMREKPNHEVRYRMTAAQDGIVLAVCWQKCDYAASLNPNQQEWLEVYRPEDWPGVWEARADAAQRAFREQMAQFRARRAHEEQGQRPQRHLQARGTLRSRATAQQSTA